MITIRASQARGLNIQAGNIKISLDSDSLVDPPPHQPMVVVKVSNVREDSLIIHIVVVITLTVVRPSLHSTLLAGLRLEVLLCHLFGIPWTGLDMIWNFKLRLATLAVFSL